MIQPHFAEIESVTSEYSAIYTDGSKEGDMVALVAIFGHVAALWLPGLPVRSSVQKLMQYVFL